MVWVKQGNRRYYYHKVCEGNQVRNIYVGTGPVAEAVAALDAEQAAQRRAAVEAHAAQYAIAASIDDAAASFTDLVQALHDAHMLLAGYHYSDHREWKLVRENWLMTARKKKLPARPDPSLALPGTGDAGLRSLLKSITQAMGPHDGAFRAIGRPVSPEHLAALIDLVRRIDCNQPGPDDLAALEQVLTANPGLWRVVADYAALTIASIAEQASSSPSARLAFVKGAEELRAGVAGAGSSPLESAVAEQIAVCWVRLRVYEALLTQAARQEDPTAIRFWDERVAGAQRRYLSACESLARIRKLAARTPQLFQINVGGQQINVAQTGSAALEEEEPDQPYQLPGST